MNREDELDGYEVLLCVTGGIACYKSASLVSRLVQAGVGVSVAMTRSARQFVGPLTFQSLSGRQVHTGMWDLTERCDIQHIALADRADLTIIAPATANIIGKIASGIADDLVSTLAMTAVGSCPVLLAPAMNPLMWSNPVVQANLARLVELDFLAVGPNEGWLACRTIGKGRMAEPGEIFAAARKLLLERRPKADAG
ncbi:MAG: phosphopantothenoylcysteine decarboxylase [Planctomycetes bacterium]|nr:phosphopantothenoylcysteine decarboxylase [Planctomycetota bacterium]